MSVLTEARALLADPSKWTKNTYARNCEGYPTPPTSPTACTFCAFGAIARVTGDNPMPDGDFPSHKTVEAGLLLDRAAETLFPHRASEDMFSPAANVNDSPTTTHADILKMFDFAINLA